MLNTKTGSSLRLPPQYLPAAYLESGPKLVGSLIAGGLYASTPSSWPGIWGWLALGPLIAVLLFEPVWRWSFTRIDITHTHLRVSTGVMIRREQSLAWDDIGAVDSRQPWAFARWRLYTVTLSQAGDERAKVYLRAADEALHREVTTRAGHALGRNAPRRGSSGESPDSLLYRVTTANLLLASVVYGQFAIIGGGVAMSAADTLSQLGADHDIGRWLPAPSGSWTLIVVAGVVATGLALTVVRYASFEVRRLPDGRLIISYGLLSTHTRSIAPGATIGVVAQRNIVETLLGRVRLSLLTTDSAAQLGTNLVLPSLPRRTVERLLREALGGEWEPPDLVRSSGLRAAGAGCLTIGIMALAATAAVWAASALRWHPLMLLVAAALALGLAYSATFLLCSEVRVDAGTGHVTLLVTHLVQRQTVLSTAAVHTVAITRIGKHPVVARICFYAGQPRTFRALRFDSRNMDALSAQMPRNKTYRALRGPDMVTGVDTDAE